MYKKAWSRAKLLFCLINLLLFWRPGCRRRRLIPLTRTKKNLPILIKHKKRSIFILCIYICLSLCVCLCAGYWNRVNELIFMYYGNVSHLVSKHLSLWLFWNALLLMNNVYLLLLTDILRRVTPVAGIFAVVVHEVVVFFTKARVPCFQTEVACSFVIYANT